MPWQDNLMLENCESNILEMEVSHSNDGINAYREINVPNSY